MDLIFYVDVDANICSNDGPITCILQEEPTTSIHQNQPTTPIFQQQSTCTKELNKQRKKERYAQNSVQERANSRARYEQMDPDKKNIVLQNKRQRESERYAQNGGSHSKKSQRKARRNTLNPESIAMENPSYIPEKVWDSVGTSASRGSIPTSEWTIPDFSGTPVYIQTASEQTTDVDAAATDSSIISHRKHVAHGERHALMCRRNEAFRASGRKNKSDTTDELLTMDTETNNGNGNDPTLIGPLITIVIIDEHAFLLYSQDVLLKVTRLHPSRNHPHKAMKMVVFLYSSIRQVFQN